MADFDPPQDNGKKDAPQTGAAAKPNSAARPDPKPEEAPKPQETEKPEGAAKPAPDGKAPEPQKPSTPPKPKTPEAPKQPIGLGAAGDAPITSSMNMDARFAGTGRKKPPPPPRSRALIWLKAAGVLTVLMLILATGAGLYGGYWLLKLSAQLPGYEHLADYQPPVMTRVHAGDGRLIAEYAKERRLFVPIGVIPKHVVNAFLSAEDKNFYEHGGVDAQGVMRAALDNIWNYMQGHRLVGASTITQQVAKNFLLTSEVSFERKLMEAILAVRLEEAYTKEEILELYLNEIYLGLGSYGVAAAALNYFDKPLDQLTVAEAAYLAALPKGPSNYHPFRQRERAIARRNWVIARMLDNQVITEEEAATAGSDDLKVTPRPLGAQLVDAEYFVEEVRRDLYERYGESKLYEGGLSVRTTLDTDLQIKARKALRDGLVAYDQRHGWRGPAGRINPADPDWRERLTGFTIADDMAPWRLAVVLSLTPDTVRIGLRPRQLISGAFADQVETGKIPFSEMEWARKWLSDKSLGPVLEKPADALSKGDVIYVAPLLGPGVGADTYTLRQIPKVNGAIVALDPHTGRVKAMVGGFSFQQSEFNRAMQASRQPGSAFKPFVYAAALDNGFTPSSLVLDAPFVMDQGPGLAFWKPENYGHQFYGPSTLRLGIEKSRNVMTVRLAQNIGMQPIIDYARRFGIVNDMPPVLSMALGAGETTLMKLTAGYAILVNGGRQITPSLVDRIQDRRGTTIYRHDDRLCADCTAEVWENQEEPKLPDPRAEIISPQTAYQVVSMLEGVVQRGTARSVRSVGVPLAGKTGTTNEEVDAWFIGFSPNLAVGVFVGFDVPKPMGRGETGGRVAAPIFRDFMAATIGSQPAVPFRIPPGLQLVRVNAKTGLRAGPGESGTILEAFKGNTLPPSSDQEVIGQPVNAGSGPAPDLRSGTGGLY